VGKKRTNIVVAVEKNEDTANRRWEEKKAVFSKSIGVQIT
jgi:hypothetical protein